MIEIQKNKIEDGLTKNLSMLKYSKHLLKLVVDRKWGRICVYEYNILYFNFTSILLK